MLNQHLSARGGEGRGEVLTDAAAIRLARIFTTVFRVPQDRIRLDLGPADIERWDSVGHVMLVTAIEHEFAIQFQVDEIMEFTSFQAILSAIERRAAA